MHRSGCKSSCREEYLFTAKLAPAFVVETIIKSGEQLSADEVNEAIALITVVLNE